MNHLHLVRTTGMLLILLVILSNIPYILLIQTFGYDDILREPVDVVLTKFHAGGTGLILTWLGFGLAALLFIPASLLLYHVINDWPTQRSDLPYLSIATLMGALSGILQAIGLMRWVFVVPVLANLYTNPAASTTTREAHGGIGMAQWGAADKADAGWGYTSILAHYYHGASLGVVQ